MAQWLTDAKHPLTSRVFVNRLWLWHFGQGLQRSPDNFGLLGQRPTNQPLLDWLAVEFIEQGWSIKQMHRLMLLSSTYQMSSTFDARANTKDPENRLWWRFNRRRLDAEEVRDALLAVGGNIDLQMYGQLLPNADRAYVTGTGSKRSTYDYNRRSVYLPILRSALYNVFIAFDFADPSVIQGQRKNTVVTPQALFMMNSKLVHDEASRLAQRVLQDDIETIYVYLKQINFGYSQNFITHTLTNHVELSRALFALFEAKFDINNKEHTKAQEPINKDIIERLESVSSLDEDRVISGYLEVIEAMVRTNYYQNNEDYLCFKIQSKKISFHLF